MAVVISLSNQKGGVGKSAAVANIGIGLARQGKKVLAVDCDPQASLSISLGMHRPDELPVTLASIMGGIIADKYPDPSDGIIHHAEGIDLMPADIELSGLEVSLASTYCRETILRTYLEIVRPYYDFIILDTNPSLGMLTINALAAADMVIIPVEAQYLSVKGLEQLLRTVSGIRRKINPALSVGGILINKADVRTNFTRDNIDLVCRTYGEDINVFKDIIPISVRAAEASAAGVSIYSHNPNGKVAAAYEGVSQEILRLCEDRTRGEVLASA